jgi:hypothetical protein
MRLIVVLGSVASLVYGLKYNQHNFAVGGFIGLMVAWLAMAGKRTKRWCGSCGKYLGRGKIKECPVCGSAYIRNVPVS